MSQLTRGQKRRLMYIELKSGYNDNGPARIGWVTFSKTGQSIYYRNQAFRRYGGAGNYIDIETEDEYWISGVKKSGSNRHPCGSGHVEIDDDAVEEYNRIRAVTA